MNSGNAHELEETEHATPFGIFLLASDFLRAAELAGSNKDGRRRSRGPERLLCYQACELSLKAYLRARGVAWDVLRQFGHDIDALLEKSEKEGLGLVTGPRQLLAKATDTKDYVRARYMVVDARSDIKVRDLLPAVQAIRESVRRALGYDEFGNPQP